MNAFIRYALVLLMLCPSVFARSRHTAYEPVFFTSESAAGNPAPQQEAASGDTGDAVEAEAADEAISGGDSADVDAEAEEAEMEESIPVPVPDTRSTAEQRTGAIHYKPALDMDSSSEADDGRRVRLELGVRCLGVWLTDDRQGKPFDGSFIGSIYKLKAKQNWAPINPYLQVKTEVGGGAWLGLGATYSHLETETLDDGGGDGDIVTDAALAYVLLERPFADGRLRPYAQVGGGIAFNSFDAIDSWSSRGRNSFDLDDSPAFLVAGGCALLLTEHLSLDAHVRYFRCDVDGHYVFRDDDRPDTDFTFPISHVAAGVGISYVF